MTEWIKRLLGVTVCCLGFGLRARQAHADFGVSSFGFSVNEAPPVGSPVGTLGLPDVQAGSHPWSMTTSIKFNVAAEPTGGGEGEPVTDGDVKNLSVALPAGLVGDPTATPKCTSKQFNTPNPGILFSGASCPDSTQVGEVAADVSFGGPIVHYHFGVYNLVAPPGVPAELGFNIAGAAVLLTPSVRTGSDYGITTTSTNTNQTLRIFGVKVTLWGVPADSSHDGYRGECLFVLGTPNFGERSCPVDTHPKPFLTLPSSCSEPLTATLEANSWQEPSVFVKASASNNDAAGNLLALIGCDRLDFSPTITVAPESRQANSPTGLELQVDLPQNANPAGLAESDLEKTVVKLPAGMSINPSAANGRAVCSQAQIGVENASIPTCPAASKIGIVRLDTPILEAPLEGALYLAEQDNNPLHSTFAVYLTAEGSGVLIKLAGRVEAGPVTGQLTTIFENNPQQPFSNLKVTLFGGPRAALANSATCGGSEAESQMTPWNGGATVRLLSPVSVTGCSGGFAPSLSAGTTNPRAGGYSPLTVTLARGDQDQAFEQLTVETPPGLLGVLSKIPLCPEPFAASAACSASSRIGFTSETAGVGPDPVTVPEVGKPEDPVYLTGPYEGAPFGLSIRVPAEAGPFNLGAVVVRAKIEVDPHTAQVIVTSDPLPTILKGVPLHIRTINVTLDRPEFIFNPTDCNALTISATVTSTQGTKATPSTPFQATNCALLPFKPKLTASTGPKGTRAHGASLTVKIAYPRGVEANIGKVKVALPKQLPSRLTTLQKACTELAFNTNPASCPAASSVGIAVVHTPVLNVPLTGPAYLVSHGGAAFPDLVMVLQGQGVKLDLVGQTNISKAGITTSTFNTVPDAPISSFELKLPTGPHSALTTNLPSNAKGGLCDTKLTMPTTITGQNNARITQSTKISVTGCHVSRGTKTKKPKSKNR
jgi:hypothetical protein